VLGAELGGPFLGVFEGFAGDNITGVHILGYGAIDEHAKFLAEQRAGITSTALHNAADDVPGAEGGQKHAYAPNP
jgi:hypothetical protein